MREGVLGKRAAQGEVLCRNLRAQHPPGYVQDVYRLQYATVTPSAPPEVGSVATPLRPLSIPSLALPFGSKVFSESGTPLRCRLSVVCP